MLAGPPTRAGPPAVSADSRLLAAAKQLRRRADDDHRNIRSATRTRVVRDDVVYFSNFAFMALTLRQKLRPYGAIEIRLLLLLLG